MLYFDFIDNSEGVNFSEGQDVVSSTELKSKQCISCRFYYFVKKNFNYDKNVCNGCYHCIIYENENQNLIFRVVTVKKGTFRTVSCYFFKEIEDILENVEIKRKFGWLYQENLKQRIDTVANISAD